MYKFVVALRYMRRNWLNIVGVLAVAIGVIVLTTVLSVMKGFDEEFRSRIRATLSDLIIESWNDQSFGDYEQVMARIEALPHVEACAPQYDGLALIEYKPTDTIRSCQFHGIDLEREIKTSGFADYWRAWRASVSGDMLAEVFAKPDTLRPPEQEILDQLSQLRPRDFQGLESPLRGQIEQWAEARKIDLDAQFEKAVNAVPSWASVEKDNTSPMFAGDEMLVIGQDLSGQKVKIPLGAEMILTTATDLKIESRRLRRCQVVGAFRSGLFDYDSQTVYLPLADVQKIMGKPGEVSSIIVRLDSFDNAPQVRAMLLGILTPEELAEGLRLVRPYLRKSDPQALKQIQGKLRELQAAAPTMFAQGNWQVVSMTFEVESALYSAVGAVIKALPSDLPEAKQLTEFKLMTEAREKDMIGRSFRISTWEDKRRTFLQALWLERRIMGFILFFVILIAGFLVLSILYTTVLSKTKDIGILKSIGGSARGIMGLFLINGLFIGAIGSAIGATIGLLITTYINEIEAVLKRFVGFNLFPREIYYMDRIPTDQDPLLSVITIVVTAIAVSLLASAYPAWKAARMDAVEALRYE